MENISEYFYFWDLGRGAFLGDFSSLKFSKRLISEQTSGNRFVGVSCIRNLTAIDLSSGFKFCNISNTWSPVYCLLILISE